MLIIYIKRFSTSSSGKEHLEQRIGTVMNLYMVALEAIKIMFTVF
jgi:hypothetical protein